MKTLIRGFVVVLMLLLSGCYVRPMGAPYGVVGLRGNSYNNGYYTNGYNRYYNNGYDNSYYPGNGYYRPSYGSHYGYGFRHGGRWR